jgi:signal transduction histidine kinase
MLLKFYNQILQTDIDNEEANISPFEVERIRLIYKIAILNFIFSVLITLFLVFIYKNWYAILFGFSLALVFLIPALFIQRKLYFLSKLAFEAVMIISALSLAIFFGRASLAEFFSLFIPVRAFIFFNKIKSWLVLSASFIAFLLIELVYAYTTPIIPLHNPIFLTIAIAIIMLLIVYYLVFLFKTEMFEINELVYTKNQELEKIQKIVEEQNNSLTESNEKLNVLNIELQQFASMASHDMREPLRTISNFGSLVEKRTKDDPRSQEFLSFIISAAKRMNGLLDDLISYARAGVPKEEVKAINLNNILIIATQNLNRLLEENNGDIQVENLPNLVGHKTLFTQLFQNLISNGLKFHKTEVNPIISIKSQITSTHIILSFQDNGIGIEPQYLTKVFEPFLRLHAVGAFEGSGIGLATCKKIMDFYKGKIEIRSIYGEGTTFELWFPLQMLHE